MSFSIVAIKGESEKGWWHWGDEWLVEVKAEEGERHEGGGKGQGRESFVPSNCALSSEVLSGKYVDFFYSRQWHPEKVVEGIMWEAKRVLLCFWSERGPDCMPPKILPVCQFSSILMNI